VLRLALIAVGAVLLWLAIPTSAPGAANDFVEYWAASRLMLDGGNPYDLTQMLAIERNLGFAGKDALPMLNPPWTLPLVLPLALLPYPASQAIWLMLNFLLLLATVELCRRVYWRWEQRPLAWMLGFSFVPALTCLAIGQITILVLLGLVGFLYFESQQQYWLAGMSLVVAAIKPHVLWLLWPAVLLWALRRGRGSVLLAFGVTLAVLTAIAWFLNPGVFQHYWQGLQGYGVLVRSIPTIGGWLMFAMGTQQPWARFLPVIPGLAWFSWSWTTNKASWCWRDRVPVLVLVSLVTGLYGWYFDQVLLLPALFDAGGRVMRCSPLVRGVVVALYAIVNLTPAVLVLLTFKGFAYTWTAPAWLALYWGVAASKLR
jgi:Glycosyltransferase family 87